MNKILEVKGLSVEIKTQLGIVKAVRNVDLELNENEILAIVGESGCGKTILCKSIQGILPKNASIVNGEIIANEIKKENKSLDGISMIFQNPMTSLNPTIKVGDQILEGIVKRTKMKKVEAKKKAIEYMEIVGIEHAKERYNCMPHEFSGGMRQRIVIAIALCTEPKILIADEPTTALDVTIQKQILRLILKLREEIGLSVIFITHDLSIVYNIADRVAVMYAGKIIEVGKKDEIFEDAKHPYTKALLESLPTDNINKKLRTLEGAPPSLIDIKAGDSFAIRNKKAIRLDYFEEPPMFNISETHKAATWVLHPMYDEVNNIEVVERIKNA